MHLSSSSCFASEVSKIVEFRCSCLQSATKDTARSEVPTTCQLPRTNCHLHGHVRPSWCRGTAAAAGVDACISFVIVMRFKLSNCGRVSACFVFTFDMAAPVAPAFACSLLALLKENDVGPQVQAYLLRVGLSPVDTMSYV